MMASAIEDVPENVLAWYNKFEADVNENCKLDKESRDRRLAIVKNDLDRLVNGNLPISMIFDTIRAHIVVRLGYQTKKLNDEVIKNMEVTVNHQKIGRNYLLLYCVYKYLGDFEAAHSLLQHVALPDA